MWVTHERTFPIGLWPQLGSQTDLRRTLPKAPCAFKTKMGKARGQAKRTDITFPTCLLCLATHLKKKSLPPNGVRYPRVGGTRKRCFVGINLKPHKLLENAQTPTRRVHAVLGGFWGTKAAAHAINIFSAH
jgi:hypothetical protein